MNQTNYAVITPEVLQEKFQVIQAPGTYKVKVRNVSDVMPSLSPVNEGGESRIINFRLIFAQDVPTLTDLMTKAIQEGREGLTYEEVGNLTASFNLEDSDPQFRNCPVRDEEVSVIVERVTVENKSGKSRHEVGSSILVVRNIKIEAAKPVTAFSWNFSVTSVEVESEDPKEEVEVN